MNHQQQAAKNSSVAPLALPRWSVPSIPAPSIHNSSNNGVHPSMDKQNKSLMPMSPLANGVTVTNQLQSNLGDMLSRQTIQTKYVTRPQTPVINQTYTMNLAPTSLPHYPGQYQQRFSQSQCQTMTLPGRGNRSGNTRTNIQHCVMDGKFAIQPPPTFAFPDHKPPANWQASLPRLVRHLPAAAAQQVRLSLFHITH